MCALLVVAPALHATDPPEVGAVTRIDAPTRTIATATIVAVPTTHEVGPGIALEPALVDLGEVRPSIGIGWKIFVRNATGEDLTITRVVPSGSGTTRPHTTSPIPVGESGEFEVNGRTAYPPGTRCTRKVLVQLGESPPAMLTLAWTIAERIRVAFAAPEAPTDRGPNVAVLELHVLDGTPFRVLDMQPELASDFHEDARESHRIDVDLEQWILAGSPSLVSILTDHPWAGRFLVRLDDLVPADELQPLARAVRSWDLSEVRQLVIDGADLDAKDPDWLGGRGALHWAAERGGPDLLKVLVEEGADLEARDRFGRTPFLVAAAQGSVETLKALHAAGAVVAAKDAAGRSALDLARLRRAPPAPTVVEWLSALPPR